MKESYLDEIIIGLYSEKPCEELRQEFIERKHVIGIAGNIGVGKSTLAEILSKVLECPVYKELDEPNPYLERFYKNPKEWAYKSQMFFLEAKARKMKQIQESEKSAIIDRTIYEDIYIFARAQLELGNMTREEWRSYEERKDELLKGIQYPEMIIYLRGNAQPTLWERINSRKRPEEVNGTSLDQEYLYFLGGLYEVWVHSSELNSKTEVRVIETDDFRKQPQADESIKNVAYKTVIALHTFFVK
ncbi:MAG: deoxynucleoside kinase [Candidatus Woesearchaeota archaeon]